MKIINKTVEVVAHQKSGVTKPLRFKIKEDDNIVVVKNINVKSTEECRSEKTKYFKYVCNGIVNDIKRVFELRFYVDNCRWSLFKI